MQSPWAQLKSRKPDQLGSILRRQHPRLPKLRSQTQSSGPHTIDVNNRKWCLEYFEKLEQPKCLSRCRRSLAEIDPKNSSASKDSSPMRHPSASTEIMYMEKIIHPIGAARYTVGNRRLESRFPGQGQSLAMPRVEHRLQLIDSLTCNTVSLKPRNLNNGSYHEQDEADADYNKLQQRCSIIEESSANTTFSVEKDIERARVELIDMSYRLVRQGKSLQHKKKKLTFMIGRVEKNAPLPPHIKLGIPDK